MTSAQNPSTVSSSIQEEVAGKNNSFKIGASIALVLAAVGTVAVVCTRPYNAVPGQACAAYVAPTSAPETVQLGGKKRENTQAWGAIEAANQEAAEKAYQAEYHRCLPLIGKEDGIHTTYDVIARAEAARAEVLANPPISGKVVNKKEYEEEIARKNRQYLQDTSRPDWEENRSFLFAAGGIGGLVLCVMTVILLAAGMTDWSCCSSSGSSSSKEKKSDGESSSSSGPSSSGTQHTTTMVYGSSW